MGRLFIFHVIEREILPVIVFLCKISCSIIDSVFSNKHYRKRYHEEEFVTT
jgi:hypothetical protein